MFYVQFKFHVMQGFPNPELQSTLDREVLLMAREILEQSRGSDGLNAILSRFW